VRVKDLEALVKISAGASLIIEPSRQDKNAFVDTSNILDSDDNLLEYVTFDQLTARIESAFGNQAKVAWVHEGVRIQCEYSLADLRDGRDRHSNRSDRKIKHQIEIFSRACQLIDSHESSDRAFNLLVALLKQVRDPDDIEMIEASMKANSNWYRSLYENQRNELIELMGMAKTRMTRKKSS